MPPARSAAPGGAWYDFIPWEDYRSSIPSVIAEVLQPRLLAWTDNSSQHMEKRERQRRAASAFGFDCSNAGRRSDPFGRSGVPANDSETVRMA